MAFTASTSGLLERLEKHVAGHLEANWVSEPAAARAALLVREELGRWTRSTYPGATLDNSALDPGSRRRLALRIHSAPVTHRVEIWGMACGDPSESSVPKGEHLGHSWIVLAHVGGPCPHLEARAASLGNLGLKRLESRSTPALTLSIWTGASAPDGCPDCRAGR
ncbi:MAG TPA: hypothetical protein VEN81_11070 [Planctomycetota bacterium]|nr:hypothetical protein [Planctomycetota bacterium]